jgi:hypothetical protein
LVTLHHLAHMMTVRNESDIKDAWCEGTPTEKAAPERWVQKNTWGLRVPYSFIQHQNLGLS